MRTQPSLAASLEDATVLMNPPIVRGRQGARRSCPGGTALGLPDRCPKGPLCEEAGSLLIDAEGRHVL